ncbi:MAG: LemA family protein [Paludibacter sp.]|jgi:LemA protein|nr:LemA family protein [Paludibacter sp.]
MTLFIIIAAIIVIIALWFILTFNNFVSKNNRVKQTTSSISVMLKQRNDMIPNLVAAVKNYVGHENGTLVKITELRSALQQTLSEKEKMELNSELSQMLSKMKITVEAYPELKADKQFLRLEESIEEMEYQLQAARRTFNAAAVDFNNYVQMFPSSIIAGMKHYQLYELIEIPEVEKANVNVSALFNS